MGSNSKRDINDVHRAEGVDAARAHHDKGKKYKPEQNGHAATVKDRRGPLPRLVIDGRDLTEAAKTLAKLLAADGRFLTNGNAPVMVTTEGEIPRAIEVTVDGVRTIAHEICRPVKVVKKDHVDVTLSKDVASLYLVGLQGRWGLKPLHGITTTPILEDNGSIRGGTDGYDPKSGLWCHAVPAVTVPERPTRREAETALRGLRTFFRTFPFADGERRAENGLDVTDHTKTPKLDESVFMVALLTAIARPSLDLAPAFLCDAPGFSGSGTGKGLLVKSIVSIASGFRPSAFTSGHDRQEFDKRLTAALTEARPAIFLDNYNAKDLKSDILASALTENPAMVRVMGESRNMQLHTRAFIGITGNGVNISEDMARRVLKAGVDAKMENPEQRKFKPGFLDSVFANRVALLSQALTIWRWGRQNTLKPGLPLGSYEVWAQWCRDPLLALGCKDPVTRVAEIKAADPYRAALIDIFEVWWKHHRDNSTKTNDLSDEVKAAIDRNSKRRDDGTLAYSRQRVADHLKRHVGTCVGGFTLTQIADMSRTRPSYSYKLINKEGSLL
jgi:putative DNA primase/helicase